MITRTRKKLKSIKSKSTSFFTSGTKKKVPGARKPELFEKFYDEDYELENRKHCYALKRKPYYE